MKAAGRSSSMVSNVGRPFIGTRLTCPRMPCELRDWICRPGLLGIVQHDSRSHMPGDLARYLFAACYAQEFGVSPTLRDFPESLLPDHANAARSGNKTVPFADRFRVQVAGKPGNTVVSHISKDGHYYIHYDPAQCRSLSVREAARIQTFPDDYFFEGNKTQQYVQVGNAVPPLLAARIAETVRDLLADTAATVPPRRPASEIRVVA